MKTLGILGGMGPIASARFLATLYRENGSESEQALPKIVLLSDPTFPDRTDLLLNGRIKELVQRTEESFEKLMLAGAEKILVCCFTLHAVLPYLSKQNQRKTISLIQVSGDLLDQEKKKALVLCTLGSRQQRIFETTLVTQGEKWLVYPTDVDQRQIHNLIYELKAGLSPNEAIRELGQLSQKYPVEAFLAGCTELHMVAAGRKEDLGPQKVVILDPLLSVARNIKGHLNE